MHTVSYRFFLLLSAMFFSTTMFASVLQDSVIRGLLERIGGRGAAERFAWEVRSDMGREGYDVFEIASRDGKPYVAGNSPLAVATGIGWYLNHTACVNLTWNRPHADLTRCVLPLPKRRERREAQVAWRYYLNYCTYSYSAAFWDWERWQQEIDWMALHGVNMPLAAVGTDVVWRNVLHELGYSEAETGSFIAGPAHQAWWLMNNLEGWGGPNPEQWYDARERLARKVVERMRAFGMEPVLPGYAGMVPAVAGEKSGWDIKDAGNWCGFHRPGFLLPTDPHFASMASLYYKHLTRLMGVSSFYSIDPFHEGGNTKGVDLPAAYRAIEEAMLRVNPSARWVVQSWNENPRPECLRTIRRGRLVVLDLFSDGKPKWHDGYGGHDWMFCMLHNFGGRVGLHGRYRAVVEGYYEALSRYPSTLKGIGATPEGIETNPMLYDLLFELPWRDEDEMAGWLKAYVEARYGSSRSELLMAWDALAASVYDCRTGQQGASESVMCARPSVGVQSVSTWSTARPYYDADSLVRAAALLLSCGGSLQYADNYAYDLTDVMRQVLADSAYALSQQIAPAVGRNDTIALRRLRESFMELILDQDRLLSTRSEFMLGRWTSAARRLADGICPGESRYADAMEKNARILITIWGTEEAANAGGLHDYANREWAGLLRDFHLARWQRFFDCLIGGKPLPTAEEWYEMEEGWTRDFSLRYAGTPQGNSYDVAYALFRKYFGNPSAYVGQ